MPTTTTTPMVSVTVGELRGLVASIERHAHCGCRTYRASEQERVRRVLQAVARATLDGQAAATDSPVSQCASCGTPSQPIACRECGSTTTEPLTPTGVEGEDPNSVSEPGPSPGDHGVCLYCDRRVTWSDAGRGVTDMWRTLGGSGACRGVSPSGRHEVAS
jgi:hypothetical protein